MSNAEILPSLINPPFPTSQSPSHVSITMGVSDPSNPHVEAAQGSITIDGEQLQNLDIGNPVVSPSGSGPAIAQAPITSTPPPNATQLPQGTQGTTVPNADNTSGPVVPGIDGPRDLTQYNDFWNAYNELADKEDKEIVKGYGSDLDTLLIFAGLFSATNTAFIIESYKDLKEDQAETTNKLLRLLIVTIHQSSESFTESLLHKPPFNATKRATSTNVFFFTSLFCSLFAAFGAVIGKQWLNHYEKEGQLRSPSERGLERHRKYLGLEQWQFQVVIETLPTLLQVSLLSFLIGLVQFLWTINLPVAIVALIFTIMTSGFWFIFIGIGVTYPNSPFQTRVTILLQKRFRFSNAHTTGKRATKDEVIGAHCVDWLMRRSTAPVTLAIVASAVAMLSENAKSAINIDRVGAVIGYLLRSRLEIDRVHLGVSSRTLQASLVTLRDIMQNWDISKDLVHSGDTGNKLFLQVLRRTLWDLLFNTEDQSVVFKETSLQVLEKLYANVAAYPGGRVSAESGIETWEARCVAWIKHFKAEAEKVLTISKLILRGPTSDEASLRLGRPLGILLQSTIHDDDGVSFLVSDQSLRVLMPILRDIISSWSSANDLVHEGDSSNRSFLGALSTKLWYMVSDTSFQNTEESDAMIFEIIQMLVLFMDEERLQPMLEALNEYLALDSIDPVHKLGCLSLVYRSLTLLNLPPQGYIECPDAVDELLLSTMWRSDGTPESYYADVRMSWVLDNFNTIYPRIVESRSSYHHYLIDWRKSNPDVSEEMTLLYFKTFRRLLITDHQVWSTRLASEGDHLKEIPQSSLSPTVRFHYLACYFLFFKEIGFPITQLQPHSYFPEEGTRIIQTGLLGLFDSMIATVDSPIEGIRLANSFWRFLIAVHRLERVGTTQMCSERDSIARYLMGRRAAKPSSFHVLDKRSKNTIHLRLRNLPTWYTANIFPAIDDVNRSAFILSLPDLDADVQLFVTEMFTWAISRVRFSDNLENILISMTQILSGPSDVLMQILERENYAEAIARLIGTAQIDRTIEPPTDVRWWCLRLFLLAWYQRCVENPNPYVSNYCLQQLNDFFSSMENRVEVDVVESQRSIDEVPNTDLSAFQFMESACTYFEFASAKWGLPISNAVALGYRETCGHYMVSGASREDEYCGNGGLERWNTDIAHLVERVENLR